HPASGRRPQENGGQGSDAPGRSRRIGGTDGVGRSHVAAALDLEERAGVGGHAPADGPSGQPPTGGRAAGGGRVQSPGQSQDARGPIASGPGRAVPVHQLVSRYVSQVNIGHGYSREEPWLTGCGPSWSRTTLEMSWSVCTERRRRRPGSAGG